MTTIKALSTISYNSEDFLKGKLNELCANGYIDFWYYIKHIGEYDVASNTADKDHIHVYLEPCRRVDTVDLQAMFVEYPDNDFDKLPLKCLPIRISHKRNEKILYDLHNEQYLISIMDKKQYHYSVDDIVTNDRDYLMEIYREAMHSDIFRNKRFIEMLESGACVSDLAYHGFIRPSQAYSYSCFENLYNMGKYRKVQANENDRLLKLENPFNSDSSDC